MGAPRLASAARQREQGRANAGRHGPAEDRLDGGARLRPSASRRSSGGHCEDGEAAKLLGWSTSEPAWRST